MVILSQPNYETDQTLWFLVANAYTWILQMRFRPAMYNEFAFSSKSDSEKAKYAIVH